MKHLLKDVDIDQVTTNNPGENILLIKTNCLVSELVDQCSDEIHLN